MSRCPPKGVGLHPQLSLNIDKPKIGQKGLELRTFLFRASRMTIPMRWVRMIEQIARPCRDVEVSTQEQRLAA
jgi:hypothetical protein